VLGTSPSADTDTTAVVQHTDRVCNGISCWSQPPRLQHVVKQLRGGVQGCQIFLAIVRLGRLCLLCSLAHIGAVLRTTALLFPCWYFLDRGRQAYRRHSCTAPCYQAQQARCAIPPPKQACQPLAFAAHRCLRLRGGRLALAGLWRGRLRPLLLLVLVLLVLLLLRLRLCPCLAQQCLLCCKAYAIAGGNTHRNDQLLQVCRRVFPGCIRPCMCSNTDKPGRQGQHVLLVHPEA